MSPENTPQHPATSMMAFCRSMSKRYAEMTSASAEAMECVLDKHKRPYRETGGRPSRHSQQIVPEVFRLRYVERMNLSQIALRLGIHSCTAGRIIKRKSSLSKDYPVQPYENKCSPTAT